MSDRKPKRVGFVVAYSPDGWLITILSPGDGAGRAKSYDLETALSQDQAEETIKHWCSLMASRDLARFSRMVDDLIYLRAGR